MNNNWHITLPSWGFGRHGSESAVSEECSKSSSPFLDLKILEQPGRFPIPAFAFKKFPSQIAHLNLSPDTAKAAIEDGLAAVIQAAGGWLRLLGKGEPVRTERRSDCYNVRKRSKQDDISIIGDADDATFENASRDFWQHLEKKRAAALHFGKIASIFLENLGKSSSQGPQPSSLAAILPTLINPFRRSPIGDVAGRGEQCTAEDARETMRPKGKLHRKRPSDREIVEPRTGLYFPLHLQDAAGDHGNGDQVLAGVGVRAQKFIRIKSVLIYAFGLYVQPHQLRKSIGEKYAGVSSEKLKHSSDFYDVLLEQGVDMTVRLVVHYRGLKMAMVRSAFESALQLRLKKYHGADKDNGLADFCSLMSGNIPVFRGTTIDFRCQAGGALQAEIGGQKIGTVFSRRLCRAFIEMYIGDPPVSEPAKLAIGESFAQMLSSTN